MPKNDNLKNQGFHNHPERINRSGRPKKFVTLLREHGYKQSEVEDTIKVMLAMNLDELRKVWENKDATILEKTIAGAMKKSLEKGTLYSLELLLTRIYGKPREQVHQTTEGTIEVVFVPGKTIL
jgi:hypothetical protein